MSAIAVSADTHGKSSVIPKRNQTMELCKFIASFFVVFIHAPFPGKLGGLVDCLARFAVPMFFMISGYFNYQATSRQVLRRLKHILALFLIGALFRQFCICLSIELNGGSTIAHLLTVIPESDEIMRLLILQIPPYTGHLWYLCAMMVCYLIFWLFVRFQEECRANYTVFYVLGGALFSIFFALDVIAPASGAMELGIHMRNGWFFGLPLFASGVFIHQYQQQILRIFSSSAWKLTVVIGLGMLLSILQWDSLGIGILPHHFRGCRADASDDLPSSSSLPGGKGCMYVGCTIHVDLFAASAAVSVFQGFLPGTVSDHVPQNGHLSGAFGDCRDFSGSCRYF